MLDGTVIGTMVRGDTGKRIRRGVFKSVPELIAAIEEFIRHTHKNPKPFVWTSQVEAILEKINHCKAVTETLLLAHPQVSGAMWCRLRPFQKKDREQGLE